MPGVTKAGWPLVTTATRQNFSAEQLVGFSVTKFGVFLTWFDHAHVGVGSA